MHKSNPTEVIRSKRGTIISFKYKGVIWTRTLLRSRLAKNRIIQNAALKVLISNHSLYKGELFISKQNLHKNKAFLLGFHPKHEILVDVAKFIVATPKENWPDVICYTLQKVLPDYTEQIWLRSLSNMKLHNKRR